MQRITHKQREIAMKTITIKNLSTFMDYTAVARVALFMTGDKYCATHDEDGNEVVRITHCGNTYTVLDKEEKQ